MSHLRDVGTSVDGNIIYKVAAVRETWEEDQGRQKHYVYYTVGADLGPYVDKFEKQGKVLGDPEPTALYSVGIPMHRREVVKRDKGPNAGQSLADVDGENEFPRLMASAPVSYTREVDGQSWLVYCRGEHLREVLAALWARGQAIHRVEVMCEGLVYRGGQVYKRLLVPSSHPHAVNPAALGVNN